MVQLCGLFFAHFGAFFASRRGLFPESLDPNTTRFIGKTGSKKNYPRLKNDVQGPYLLLIRVPKPVSDRPGLSDSSNGSCSKIGLVSYLAYLKGRSFPGPTLIPANF